MIKNLIKLTTQIFLGILPLQAATVFIEDFSTTTTLPSINQGYLGFFNNNISPGGIVVSSNSSIINNALIVNTTNGFRGIGIALDSTVFPSAGVYKLQFDIVSFDPGMNGSTVGNGFAEIGIYSGDGYQSNNDGNALLLNAETGQLTSLGSASVNQLVTQQFSSVENNVSIEFNYSGNGAIAIFLGAETSSFPFPTIEYDNISVTSVPEPSAVLLVMLSPVVLFKRKRYRKSYKSIM